MTTGVRVMVSAALLALARVPNARAENAGIVVGAAAGGAIRF